MNASLKNMAVALFIMSAPIAVQAKQWSLQDQFYHYLHFQSIYFIIFNKKERYYVLLS